jgi:ketosteroid isomerase-like protein
MVGAFLVGPFTSPALAKMYSCQDATGRIVLRDVPCKRDETDRNAAAARARATTPARVRQIENANPITEAQVRELVDRMDAARVRRDVAAMLAYVAPDAVFEVEYRLPQGMQFKRFSKNEYAAYLRGGTEFVDGLDFQRESTTILVAPAASQAEIISTLRETVRIQGEPLARVTRSKSLVEVREGRATIVLVRAIMRYEVPERPSRVGSQQTKGRASGR